MLLAQVDFNDQKSSKRCFAFIDLIFMELILHDLMLVKLILMDLFFINLIIIYLIFD